MMARCCPKKKHNQTRGEKTEGGGVRGGVREGGREGEERQERKRGDVKEERATVSVQRKQKRKQRRGRKKKVQSRERERINESSVCGGALSPSLSPTPCMSLALFLTPEPGSILC